MSKTKEEPGQGITPPNAAPGKASATSSVTEPENTPSANDVKPDNSVTDNLKSLSELAALFRVPTWQQAALERLMGWAKGKSVTEEAYSDALDSLNSRRMGSGRKE